MSDRVVIAGGSRSDRVMIDSVRLAPTGLHHLFFRGVFCLCFSSLFGFLGTCPFGSPISIGVDEGVQHINDHHDVDSLCRQFPDRLQAMIDNEGGRINKGVGRSCLGLPVKMHAP